MSERFEWTPDFWQGWRESENPYRRYKSQRDRELALRILKLRGGESVLEVGCGYGWISRVLWDSAQIRWFGVDRSAKMVRHLRASSGRNADCAISADASHLPFADGQFDKVLCTGVLMHIKEDDDALRELVRVLRPGGRLLCSVNNLLSFYSLPVILWNHRKTDFVQKFRIPFKVAALLRGLDIRSLEMAGDGILATVNLSIGPLQIPPRFAFPLVRSLDGWFVEHFAWLAYEVWFTGLKSTKSCAS